MVKESRFCSDDAAASEPAIGGPVRCCTTDEAGRGLGGVTSDCVGADATLAGRGGRPWSNDEPDAVRDCIDFCATLSGTTCMGGAAREGDDGGRRALAGESGREPPALPDTASVITTDLLSIRFTFIANNDRWRSASICCGLFTHTHIHTHIQ